MNAIEVTGVTKRYKRTVALDGVTLVVPRGQLVALLGPNGAGKSTLVSLLLGLRRPDEGRVSVLGGPPSEAAAAGRLGAMLQSGALKDLATVERLVGLFAQLYPSPLPVAEALDRAGIGELRGSRADRLSGGQAQRVRFALAIVGNPELVFLDEPTAAMDVAARHAFWETIREWAASGRTVVFASHHLEEVEAVADRVVVLSRGRLVADGDPRSLRHASRSTTVRFELDRPRKRVLERLASVDAAAIEGTRVVLRSSDGDATVAAIYRAGLVPRSLAVEHGRLSEIFLELTKSED